LSDHDDKEPIEGILIPLADDYEGADLGGRPRMYETPEAFDAAVQSFYEYCRDNPPEPISLYGLILFMGFADYSSFYAYRNYDGFSQSVTRARSLVMYGYERNMLLTKNAAAGKVLAAMDSGNFNPTIVVDPNAQGMTHEDRLKHLR